MTDKDIPEWDGEYHSFDEFAERCYWFRRGLRKSDRPLAVSRIIRKLKGSSWTLARRLNKHKLNSRKGLEHLLMMIKDKLLVPKVQEVGKYIKGYFEDLRCKRNETIAQYCNRERIVYHDMCKAIKNFEKGKSSLQGFSTGRDGSPGRTPRDRAPSRPRSRAASIVGEVTGDVEDDYAEDLDEEGDGTTSERRARRVVPGEAIGSASRQPSRDRGPTSDWSVVESSDGSSEDLEDEDDSLGILPDKIQGYILLARAGLSADQEREVQASAQNSLDRKDVENALRALYWDRRPVGRDDKAPRRGNFMGQDGEDEQHEDLTSVSEGWADDWSWGTPSTAYFSGTGEEWDGYEDEDEDEAQFADDDDYKCYMDAASTLKGAFVQMKSAQRNMVQARAIMRDIKIGRGYDRPAPSGKGKGKKGKKGKFSGKTGHFSKGKGKGGGGKKGGKARRSATADDVCYTCGTAGHFGRDCPDKARFGNFCGPESHWDHDDWQSSEWEGSSQAGYWAGHAGYLCIKEACMKAGMNQNSRPGSMYPTGEAYLDCGATDTFGGVEAVEDFSEEYTKRFKAAGVNIDTSDRPEYIFGNGGQDAALCRADLQTWVHDAPTSIGVHAVDTSRVPILIGMNTLRKLGAVVDFDLGLAVFKNIDSNSIRQLPRHPSGLLALNLFEDLSRQGHQHSTIDAGATDDAFIISSLTKANKPQQQTGLFVSPESTSHTAFTDRDVGPDLPYYNSLPEVSSETEV